MADKKYAGENGLSAIFANIKAAIAGKADVGLINSISEDVGELQEDVTNSYKVMGEMGAKNLIPYPYYETTKTVNGITFTDNGDGTVTVNGTANGTANFIIANEFVFTENESYMLTGCPSGGASDTYRQYIITYGGDTGEGKKITPTSGSGLSKQILIQVFNGTTLSNVTFKPMLRFASDTDNTWQLYAKTNKQLTDDVAGLVNKLNFNHITTNLNDYRECGVYTFDYTATNKPTTHSGAMLVLSTATASGGMQIACTYGDNYLFVRYFTGTTFTNWVSLAENVG